MRFDEQKIEPAPPWFVISFFSCIVGILHVGFFKSFNIMMYIVAFGIIAMVAIFIIEEIFDIKITKENFNDDNDGI